MVAIGLKNDVHSSSYYFAQQTFEENVWNFLITLLIISILFQETVDFK